MNNWYKIAKDLSKIAQIWNYDIPDEDLDEYTGERTFSSKIKELYELEYKYSMLNNKPFLGSLQRQENISNQLEKNIKIIGHEIRDQLMTTLKNWLNKHALLSSGKWADERVNDAIETTDGNQGIYILVDVLREYNKYIDETGRDKKTIFYLIDIASQDINSYPYLKLFLEQYAVEGYVEWLKEEIYDNLDDFNFRYNKSFKDVDEAIEWAEEQNSIENVDINEMLYLFTGGDEETIMNQIDSNGQPFQIAQEFYKNLVFPLWYEYWSSQGIEETRENIEEIYDYLKKSKNQIGDLMASINMGLNAVHQTGSMLDYLSEDTGDNNLAETLNDATEGKFIDKANKELKSIGVKI